MGIDGKLFSHTIFAHDLLIIVKACPSNCHSLMDIFNDYQSINNQKININKSQVLYCPNFHDNLKNNILLILVMKEGHFPFKYLGTPIS